MDQRTEYYDSINHKLSLLAYRIEVNGGLNLLNDHVHAEDFYLHLANLVFDWNLQNLNTISPTAAGIDLIDTNNRIVIQVSSTATRQKIESALSKKQPVYDEDDYSFKFLSICKDVTHLQSSKKKYKNPCGLTFTPTKDIIDIKYLLRIIKSLEIDRLQAVYELLEKEFKFVPNNDKIDSNLATIIRILSRENWGHDLSHIETNSYEINEKIEANNLMIVTGTIEEHAPRYHRISKIYAEFDAQGLNKSISILNGIRRIYLNIVSTKLDYSSDQVFLEVIKQVVKKIRNSANYQPIPAEELELCAEVLVVDTFIRCKIFKNPNWNQLYANS